MTLSKIWCDIDTILQSIDNGVNKDRICRIKVKYRKAYDEISSILI